MLGYWAGVITKQWLEGKVFFGKSESYKSNSDRPLLLILDPEECLGQTKHPRDTDQIIQVRYDLCVWGQDQCMVSQYILPKQREKTNAPCYFMASL